MVVYREELWCRYVGVFRWNEKLAEEIVGKGDVGVFVFHVDDKLTTCIPGRCDFDSTWDPKKLKRRVIGFQARRLLGSDESIERLIGEVIEATGLFGGLGSFQPLEGEVLKALKSHFSCEQNRNGLLPMSGRPVPITVIYVGALRWETCEYGVEDFRPYPTVDMMLKPTHLARRLLDGEARDWEGDGEVDPRVVAQVNKEECLGKLIHDVFGYELMMTLRSPWWWPSPFPSPRGRCGPGMDAPLPITSDEVLGLLGVGGDPVYRKRPRMRMVGEDGVDMPDDVCYICLGEYELGQDVATLSCSHVFHRCCIAIWMWRTGHHRCPVCQDLV